MPTSQNFHQKIVLIDYMPATLHEGKCWYISYYVKHPQTNRLHRKQIKVNRIKSKSVRRKWAKKLVQDINIKLAQGWNPFIEQEAPKGFHNIFDVFDSFLHDKRSLRKDTLKNYSYELISLKKWIEINYGRDLYAISFDRYKAIKLMEDIYKTRNIGPLRYNNILVFYRLVFNWMIEHAYMKSNPFEGMKKKKELPKKRVMDIEPETRQKIKVYLLKDNPNYYVMVLFAYHCLLRPKEIMEMKIQDINLENQIITVRGEVSKNTHTRMAAIPDVMIEYVRELVKDHYSEKNLFVFSGKKFKPGIEKGRRREHNRYWQNLREKLNLTYSHQFYSLRDSGIIQMLRDGRNPIEVKDQADHSSLAVTNVYVIMARKTVSQGIMKESNPF